MRLVRPAGWAALAGMCLVLAAFVVWCFLGSVQTTFTGAGVLVSEDGVSEVLANETGQLTHVFAQQGDEVVPGERVATIETGTGTSTVIAHSSGRVLELLAYPGHKVDKASVIATIQPQGQELRCVLFVPVSTRQPIKPGMPAQISVTTAPSEQYGLLLGRVTRVGTHPATRAGVKALLGNDDIAAIVVGGAPVVQIEVALTPNAGTATGYTWSTSNGPPETLAPGTLVNSQIVTAVTHPIQMLFPSTRTNG